MTPYTWAGDNPEPGMSSFTWQEPGASHVQAQPATYRVCWTWRGQRRVSASGLSYEEANYLCNSLNLLASQYNQDDEYTVEAE